MFSIVIPLYNKEISITKTLKSVINQTFQNFEIVLVNDGSTDNSLRVVKAIDDSRIRVIDKPNGGVSSARNRGVKEAKNEWVTFLDADDLWKPNHLETIYNMIMKFPQESVFCTSFIRSNQTLPTQQNNTISIIENYFEEAIKYHFFWTSVTCIHNKVFKDVGYFLENFSRGEDLELWERIGRQGFKFIKSNLVTAVYNVDTENKITKSKYNYKNSSLLTIHNRNRFFKSKQEKKYFIKIAYNSVITFLSKFDAINCFRSSYRLLYLWFKPVNKGK
ncbi:MAG: glycosyltransferase family 2 protein [Sphingobacterium sp.]|jgi:glycosyltransferase involved in cell wall biosynthesis|nr:glycosyltransferase family 2 protein [Sphingobacterium sp.]